MRKTIEICDCCRKDLEEKEHFFHVDLRYWTFDLCPECAKMLVTRLTPLIEDDVPKDVKPKRKKTDLDLGKIGALYAAGWTAKKIAEEMNCSDQTIRNHLNEAITFYNAALEVKNGQENV